MNHKTLQDFLTTCDDVYQVNECLYRLKYAGIDCLGIINRTWVDGVVRHETLSIRPRLSTMDIGTGAGQSESFFFNYYN